MSRRILWLILVMLVPVLALTACGKELPFDPPAIGQPTAEPAEEVAGPCAPADDGPMAGLDPRGAQVVWWHSYSGAREDQLLALVHQFNSGNYCRISVSAENHGSYEELRDKMNVGTLSGDLPGLVVGYQRDQALYGLDGGLADLNPYVNDARWGLTGEEKADFYSLELGVHPSLDNLRLGFPLELMTIALYYNQTWLTELGYEGPPTTPEEFQEMACAASGSTEDDTGGHVLQGDATEMETWTLALGGSVLDGAGTGYAYSGEPTAQAITLLKGMYDQGCAHVITETHSSRVFAARQAIFALGSTSELPYYESDVNELAREAGRNADEWGVAAVPHATAEPVQLVYGRDLLIPATTPETQLAAWIFVKWLTSPENQAAWVQAGHYLPGRVSASEHLIDYMGQNPRWAMALGLLPHGAYGTELISYPFVDGVIERAYGAILEGADMAATLDVITLQANQLQAELMVRPE